MKRKFLYLTMILFMALIATSCNNGEEYDEIDGILENNFEIKEVACHSDSKKDETVLVSSFSDLKSFQVKYSKYLNDLPSFTIDKHRVYSFLPIQPISWFFLFSIICLYLFYEKSIVNKNR